MPREGEMDNRSEPRIEGFFPKTATILFFLCIILVLIIPIKTPFNAYDEGFSIFNGVRVLNGDFPYKDFWTIYSPGQFYTLAAIFRVFGATVLVARIYDTILRFLFVLIIYSIIKRGDHGRRTSVLICTAAALVLGSAGYYAYAIFPSLLFCLLSILSLLKHLETGQRRWLWLEGMLIGFASLFRWDFGLYAGIGGVSTVFIFQWFGVARQTRSAIKATHATAKLAIFVLGGALAIALPGYGYLIYKSGLSNLWAQLIAFPITTFRSVRGLQYPSPIAPLSSIPRIFSALGSKIAFSELLAWLRFYSPLAIYSLSFLFLARSFIRGRDIAVKKHFLSIATTILGVLLFAQALSRFDSIHVLPTSIVALIVVASYLHDGLPIFRPRILRTCIMGLILIALGAQYFLAPLYYLASFLRNYSPLGCYSNIPKANCVSLGKDQEQAIEFIRTHTRGGEPIFVGNLRHDLIFINDIGFYFLSDRPSATAYHELHPGVATTLPVQKTIAGEIESKNVIWIVLVNIPESGEPNASAMCSGVHYLDEFVQSQYVKYVDFGNYSIFRRAIK